MKKVKVKISPKAIELAKTIVARVTQTADESRDAQIALMIAGDMLSEIGWRGRYNENGVQKATYEAAIDLLYPEDAYAATSHYIIAVSAGTPPEDPAPPSQWQRLLSDDAGLS